ncbi:MAG: site-2 protease family protein [Planctomycetota bacterium]|nr:site-2 protease family protein [Planctomycetota bacterium]MDP6937397.1 site-2 protease family protein [Planctomycetota bacterium]
MPPQTIQIALGIAFLILSLGVHEAAHAYVADRCGDGTAREEGRLTLNPMAHIDPFMTIVLPLILYMTSGFIFGGARPVPVNPMRLRYPLRDMSFVALAGPISNLILALLFSVAWKAMIYWGGMPTSALAPRVMEMALTFNIILAVFNMIPIPPLDGSRVMAYLLPSHMREPYVSLERFGLLIVVLLVMTGSLGMILGATLGPMIDVVDTLTGGRW